MTDDNIRYTLLGSNAGSSLQTERADIRYLLDQSMLIWVLGWKQGTVTRA